MAFKTKVYNKVTEAGLLNYRRAWLQLPSNLHFSELEALARTEEDTKLINFLKYGFPMGYDSPVPTLSDHNKASAMHHPMYVLTEFEEGVMLGPV